MLSEPDTESVLKTKEKKSLKKLHYILKNVLNVISSYTDITFNPYHIYFMIFTFNFMKTEVLYQIKLYSLTMILKIFLSTSKSDGYINKLRFMNK